MKAKSPFTETVIASSLVAIFERLGDVEKAILALSKVPRSKIVSDAVLLERLARLTLKRHAVLTATLGGLSYQEIAKLMACDVSTIKLHLKAALQILRLKDRAFLLAAHSNLLQTLSDKEYLRRYGLSKTWWLESSPSIMTVLQATKPAKNQYTKG